MAHQTNQSLLILDLFFIRVLEKKTLLTRKGVLSGVIVTVSVTNSF